jgi:hypothetical protein
LRGQAVGSVFAPIGARTTDGARATPRASATPAGPGRVAPSPPATGRCATAPDMARASTGRASARPRTTACPARSAAVRMAARGAACASKACANAMRASRAPTVQSPCARARNAQTVRPRARVVCRVDVATMSALAMARAPRRLRGGRPGRQYRPRCSGGIPRTTRAPRCPAHRMPATPMRRSRRLSRRCRGASARLAGRALTAVSPRAL